MDVRHSDVIQQNVLNVSHIVHVRRLAATYASMLRLRLLGIGPFETVLLLIDLLYSAHRTFSTGP